MVLLRWSQLMRDYSISGITDTTYTFYIHVLVYTTLIHYEISCVRLQPYMSNFTNTNCIHYNIIYIYIYILYIYIYYIYII